MKKIITGILLGVMAVSAYGSESDGIFSYKAGRFEIFMLVESQRSGSADIIAGVDESVIYRYIPDGFMLSTNTFLVKTPRLNVLVDTGTGRQGEPVYEKIRSAGVEPEQIDAVLLTHLHGDHFGGLLKDGRPAFPRAKIYLSTAEYEYFTRTQPNEDAVAALAPYGSRVVTFEPNQLGSEFKSLLPGIAPIAAYGHTPGHTMYLFADVTGKFLIWGDLLHVAPAQFPIPEISATYDMEPQVAARIRRQVMNYAAGSRTPIGGMHIVYPAIGNVETDGNGFRFIPAPIPRDTVK